MENEKEGFPITAIREVKLLKNLSHANVVNLKEIVTSPAHDGNQNKGSIYMVFEYLDHDLVGLMERPGHTRFPIAQTKCYMLQLVRGIAYIHKSSVLHRDIKGSNLLINNRGELKIGDFGLARTCTIEKGQMLTNRVITLWYRPPELLLGANVYGPEVDMWSVGCLIAELIIGKAILPGRNEADQLDKIFHLCGHPREPIEGAEPSELDWPGVSSLQSFSILKKDPKSKRRLGDYLRSQQSMTDQAIDLICKLLTLDPKKRPTAVQVGTHDWFVAEDPLPAKPEDLPRYEASHEYQAKKRKQEARAAASGGAAGPGAGGGAAGRPQDRAQVHHHHHIHHHDSKRARHGGAQPAQPWSGPPSGPGRR